MLLIGVNRYCVHIADLDKIQLEAKKCCIWIGKEIDGMMYWVNSGGREILQDEYFMWD